MTRMLRAISPFGNAIVSQLKYAPSAPNSLQSPGQHSGRLIL